MDRETVNLTLLAEALEMNWHSYTVYEPLAELDAFLDRNTAVKLAEALKSGFMLEESVEEIMNDGFFRGYLAGMMLHDDSLSLESKEEMAVILLDNLLSVFEVVQTSRFRVGTSFMKDLKITIRDSSLSSRIRIKRGRSRVLERTLVHSGITAKTATISL